MSDPAKPAAKPDDPMDLVRAYERVGRVKRELIRAGLLDGDATPDAVFAVLRKLLPVKA